MHIDNPQVKPGRAHLAFADLPFDIVITTNFDFLLEKAYSAKGRPCYPITEQGQLSVGIEPSSINKVTRILKIHGDVNCRPDRLVVTEDDYDNFMETYPVLCTYISNLLISRTPVFIGYSLDDPDFRGLWQIIGSRLGNERRRAYVLAWNINNSNRARFERRGVKVISLNSYPVLSTYSDSLKNLFEGLREGWLVNAPSLMVAATEELLSETALPPNYKTRLCFFAISYDFVSFYRSNVFPVFEYYGFTPITINDMIIPADRILAAAASLIERAALVVIDMCSPKDSYTYELKLALDKNRSTIIIGGVSPDVSYLSYGRTLPYFVKTYIIDISTMEDNLVFQLEDHLKQICYQLVQDLDGQNKYIET